MATSSGSGIVLTPDGKKLLMGESQKNRILVYDVVAPGKVANRKTFADLPAKDTSIGQIDNQPDGMCLDAAGNLFVARRRGAALGGGRRSFMASSRSVKPARAPTSS
jgi:sugar lactone lactonase YvrE